MRGGPTANHQRLFAIVPRQERRLARRADLKPQPVSLGALALTRGAHPAAVDTAVTAPEPLWDPDVHPSWILNSHLWAPRRILTEGSLDGRHSFMACPSAAWYVGDDERRQQDSGYVEPCRGLAHVALRYSSARTGGKWEPRSVKGDTSSTAECFSIDIPLRLR